MVEYWKLKGLVLKHYGEICIECGEVDPKQLRIIFADKNMQSWRKKFGLKSTKDFYYYLYRNDFPEKFKEPGKYKLITLCKFHYGIFVSTISRPEEVKTKISQIMRMKKKVK